ncbi:MAG: hypothetical protein GXO97_03610 [Nitrospirae bacterium]|nr:hypothetical protein [Nitrospirota bacterium]
MPIEKGLHKSRHMGIALEGLQVIHKVVGVSYCRYCYMGLLHHHWVSMICSLLDSVYGIEKIGYCIE